MSGKPTLCLDFDGVIHSYKSGWVTASFIPDAPVPGAFEFMHRAMEHFSLCIYSSRSGQEGGVPAMRTYIEYWAPRELDNVDPFYRANGLVNYFRNERDAWPLRKPAAFLTIDDRALKFTGDWSELDPVALLKFKPWNK